MITKRFNILLLFILTLRCTIPNEPKSASWDVQLNHIPLLKGDTLILSKELKGQDVIVGSDSVLSLSATGESPFTIDDNLNTPPESLSVSIINPALNSRVRSQFQLSGSQLTISSASILSGSIDIEYQNNASVPVTVTVEIPGLTKGSTHFSSVQYLYKGGSASVTSKLDNWLVSLPGGSLPITAEVFGSFLPDSIRDYINIKLHLSKQEYSDVTANITTSKPFPSTQIQGFKDPPNVLQNIHLNQAILILTFNNFPFSLNPLDVTLQSQKNSSIIRIPVRATIPANSVTNVRLDNTGVNNNGATPTVVDMANQLPQQFTMSGDIGIRGTNSRLVRGTNYKIQYSLSIPFDFSAPNSTIEEVKQLNLDKDARDAIKDHLIRAEMTGEIVNATSFNGSVSLMVGPDTASLNTVLIWNDLLPATLNSSGVVVTPRTFTMQAVLDKAKLNQLLEARYYKVQIHLEVNQGKIRANDYVIIRKVYLAGIGKVEL